MQIGVFGQIDSWYVNELCRSGTRRGHVLQPLSFPQLSSSIESGRLQLTCEGIALEQFDAVIVRTMPPGTLEQVVARMDLLAGLEAQGVRVVNSPKALECAVDKYLTTQRLCLAGLPVPMTVVCESADAAQEAFARLEGDVVLKPVFGAEGRGIMRISDPELALRAFRTLERLGALLYLQKFIAGPGFDLRVLLLDDDVLGAMKRIPKDGDFRANISQQGRAVTHPLTPQERELAIAAARVTGSRFAGVDLMYDHHGQPLIIEVNAVPGWRGLQSVCQVDVPDRLFQWLESQASVFQS